MKKCSFLLKKNEFFLVFYQIICKFVLRLWLLYNNFVNFHCCKAAVRCRSKYRLACNNVIFIILNSLLQRFVKIVGVL